MSYDLSIIESIYEAEQNITATARRYAKEQGIDYNDNLRRKFSNIINKNFEVSQTAKADSKKEVIKKEASKTNDEVGFNMPSAWDSGLDRFLSIEEYCERYGLDIETVKNSRLCAHNAGHMIYNIEFKKTIAQASGIDEDFIKSIIESNLSKVPKIDSGIGVVENSEYFDRLVITDVHVNMSPKGEKNTDPLYSHTWNREDVFGRLEKTINHVLKFKKGNVIVIDDLGDFMDGLQAQTTRGGHALPQEDSDKEAFRIGIDFKVRLADALNQHYDKIIFNNVTNDNHSFLFGYFVNYTSKGIIEQKYSNVEYNIQEKFLEHYSMGKHTFVITHGKDSGEKKFGFPAQFHPKVYEPLDQYCKNRMLYNGNFIEVSKGDSHQRIFDTTSCNDFSYCSYGAFSPPSNWVGTNFKDTASSIDFFNISYEENIKLNVPLIF